LAKKIVEIIVGLVIGGFVGGLIFLILSYFSTLVVMSIVVGASLYSIAAWTIVIGAVLGAIAGSIMSVRMDWA